VPEGSFLSRYAPALIRRRAILEEYEQERGSQRSDDGRLAPSTNLLTRAPLVASGHRSKIRDAEAGACFKRLSLPQDAGLGETISKTSVCPQAQHSRRLYSHEESQSATSPRYVVHVGVADGERWNFSNPR
jgi:hypothetical protein